MTLCHGHFHCNRSSREQQSHKVRNLPFQSKLSKSCEKEHVRWRLGISVSILHVDFGQDFGKRTASVGCREEASRKEIEPFIHA